MATYHIGEISALIKKKKGKKNIKKGEEKHLFEENAVHTLFGEFVKKGNALQQKKKGKSKFIKRAAKKVTWKNPVVEMENKKTVLDKAAGYVNQIKEQENIEIKEDKKKRKFSEGIVEVVDMNSIMVKKKDKTENITNQKNKKIKTDFQHHPHFTKEKQKMKMSFEVKECASEKKLGVESSRVQDSQPKFMGGKKSNETHMNENIQNSQKCTNNFFIASPIHQKVTNSSLQSENIVKNKAKKKAKKLKFKNTVEISKMESTNEIVLSNKISTGKKSKCVNANINFQTDSKSKTESETSVLHKNPFDASKAFKKSKKNKQQHLREEQSKFALHNVVSSDGNNPKMGNSKLHTLHKNSSKSYNNETEVDDYNIIKEINALQRAKSMKKHKKKKIVSGTVKNCEKENISDPITIDISDDFESNTEDESLVSKDIKNKHGNNKANKKLDNNEEEHFGNYIKLAGRKLRGFEGREDTPERFSRTLFVGNLPTDFSKKNVKILFRPFGEVECIRLRSAVPTKPSIPKKVAVIKQEFHSERNSISAYVVFRKIEDAHKALDLNGCVVSHHHLRVDLATNNKNHDNKRSVFIGNLPFNINEDELRAAFNECGKIEGIRIIRDADSGVSKGFGFILFEKEDAVSGALRLEGTVIQGREIRVKLSKNMQKVETKKDDFLKRFQKDRNHQKKYGGIEFQGKKSKGIVKRNKGGKKIKRIRKRINLKKKAAAILKNVNAKQNAVK